MVLGGFSARELQCWLPCEPDMAATKVTECVWGYGLVKMEYFKNDQTKTREELKSRPKSQGLWHTVHPKATLRFSKKNKWGSSLGSPKWPPEAAQHVSERKDERPININLPLRPPFQAPKYLIVLGQLSCFVGRACVDPCCKTTPVPAQWRPCPVAPHCPRNGRLQRIQDFFHHS